MMNCQQATKLISASQELALSLHEKLRLKMHVTMCSGCRNFSLQLPFLNTAMNAYAKGQDEGPDANVKN